MLELVDAPETPPGHREGLSMLGTHQPPGAVELGRRKALGSPRADTRSVETTGLLIQEHTGALGREASGLGSVRREVREGVVVRKTLAGSPEPPGGTPELGWGLPQQSLGAAAEQGGSSF